MPTERPPPFNAKSFLAKVGEGRCINTYGKEHIVFSQGEPADAVFYIQKGKVKMTSSPSRARKLSSQCWVRTTSWASLVSRAG